MRIYLNLLMFLILSTISVSIISCDVFIDNAGHIGGACTGADNNLCIEGICQNGLCVKATNTDGDSQIEQEADKDLIENQEKELADNPTEKDKDSIENESTESDSHIEKPDGDDDSIITDGDTTTPVDGDIDITETSDETSSCTLDSKKCIENSVFMCSNINGNPVWKKFQDCESNFECKDGYCNPIPGKQCTKDGTECEDDEYCFLQQDSSTSGNCMKVCTLGDVYCPRGFSCAMGACVAIKGYCKSNLDCSAKEFCDKLFGASDGMCRTYCIEQGVSCEANYKCDTSNTSPNYGRCIPVDPTCKNCDYVGDCGTNQYCEIPYGKMNGCCRDKCGESKACERPLVCVNNRCVVHDGKNDCGGPCATGYICDQFFNACALNCPNCPEGHCCDAESAPNCYECVCQNPGVCGLLLPNCCFGYTCNLMHYGLTGFCE